MIPWEGHEGGFEPHLFHLAYPCPPYLCLCLSFSQSFYFSRENGFPESLGFFFLRLAQEKHKGMQKLLELQNDHGGLVIFYTVSDPPPPDEWGTILHGMETALALEKLNQSFLELHEIGMVQKDPHVRDHPTPSLRGSLQA